MPLDKLLIGTRIRKIREEKFAETRKQFAERCGLTDTHIGQIERRRNFSKSHSNR